MKEIDFLPAHYREQLHRRRRTRRSILLFATVAVVFVSVRFVASSRSRPAEATAQPNAGQVARPADEEADRPGSDDERVPTASGSIGDG
jgi:hypothetical protein